MKNKRGNKGVGNIWFTSDTHFGHRNIIKYCNRPFSSIEEHDEMLITNWNSVIGINDEIYHLGDFGFCTKTEKLENILKRLMGKKHLIRGNHDKQIKGRLLGCFESVSDYKEIKIPDNDIKGDVRKVILFHYPIESWNKRHYESYHLHGHCHNTLPSPDYQMRVDVGVDVWNYFPVHYDEIKRHMKQKNLKPIDHHGSR